VSKEGLRLGRAAEDLAACFLRNNGYKIIRRNYRSPFGEIDIIASDKAGLAFVEVKSRRCGIPAEAVSARNRRHICLAAVIYLKANNLLNKKARFDVVSVKFSQGRPKIDLIKNAFELEEGFFL